MSAFGYSNTNYETVVKEKQSFGYSNTNYGTTGKSKISRELTV
jgi:hypothetical protein